MEEFQEADVLWPETPPPPAPPWGDHERYLPELREAAAAAAADFSCESFGSDMSDPASSSSSASSSSALPFGGRGSSDGFLSDASTFAGGHGGDDASFQEADVLWPDDGYPTRPERGVVDGGELWWLCCGLGVDDAGGRPAERVSAGGKRGAWRAPLASSPIDIPTRVASAAAARGRRRSGATAWMMD